MKLGLWILLIIFTAQTVFAAAEGVSEISNDAHAIDNHCHIESSAQTSNESDLSSGEHLISQHSGHQGETEAEHQHNCHGHFHYAPALGFLLQLQLPPTPSHHNSTLIVSTPLFIQYPALRPPISA